MNPRGKPWYRFIRWAARYLFFGALGGMRSEDSQKVPMEGPVILAPVHFSYLDPMIVSCGTARAVSFMAKKELFEVFGLGWLIRSLDAFPVERGAGDSAAIRHAIEMLQQGRALILFPEGTRGDGKTLGPITPGVAMLARRTGAKIVPVGVVGTQVAWPKHQKRPRRHRTKVIYGDPFTYEEATAGLGEKEKRTAFAEYLSQRLIELCARGGLILALPPKSTDD
ncbi:MAG TPA: lysophospholipid acyltransferase family protein [Fimbriimonadaceae bacterium]|nr:lysophospholipid acyltransferase family protein [Fimbriimonadaceae bacterium]HRJ96388.1 lysophospholipid acyltransferase family protein [Fimbriimonadaceae bacterium]